MGRRRRRMERWPPAQQCTATAQSTGRRCRKMAVRGAEVCRTHGANLPRIRAAADREVQRQREALAAAAAQPAAEELLAALSSGSQAVRVAAAAAVIRAASGG